MASSSSGDGPRKKAMCRSVWLRRQQKAKLMHSGVIRVPLGKTNAPPYQQADISEISTSKMPVLELDKLPEDLLHHIHSLMPLCDAARAACVSHRFLRSWRRFPILSLNRKTFGLDGGKGFSNKLASRIHSILGNHSGIGVKTLELPIRCCRSSITANHINAWLQSIIKSGILKLHLDFPEDQGQVFTFPCFLLSRGANSLQYLSLSCCIFRPTPTVGCLRNLKRVLLQCVHITEEELECFLSFTISLENLEISQCSTLTFLKVPSHLQQLSILCVIFCRRLNVIEIYAPKVTKFVFVGPPTKILIKDMSRLKDVTLSGILRPGMFKFALTNLNSLASNVQTLTVRSSVEDFDMLTVHDKFHNLRSLNICCSGIQFPNYDFLSLVSFLEACPVLVNFFLSAGQPFDVRRDSILEDCHADFPHIRQIPGFYHDKLKKVRITGFSSAKSLIELTCQIVERSSSLEHLVLDTTTGYDYMGKCGYMTKTAVEEALKGVQAINKYVMGKVSSRVNLEVLEPCDQCHISKVHGDVLYG